MKVVVLESAEADLLDLKRYLVQRFSSATWLDSYAGIKAAIRNLAEFPYAGVVPAEIEQLGLHQYRQVLSGMNRIIYEVRGNAVYTHIIADARQDMKSLLSKRLLRAAPPQTDGPKPQP